MYMSRRSLCKLSHKDEATKIPVPVEVTAPVETTKLAMVEEMMAVIVIVVRFLGVDFNDS